MEQAQNLRARRPDEEVWETTVLGKLWMEVTDDKGRPRPVSVGGRVGAKLRITREDREIVQEQIVDVDLDPFLNGMLVRVDADQNEDPRTESVNALNDEQLLKIFALDGNAFKTAVEPLGEVSVRRMLECAEAIDASTSQVKYLTQLVEDRYRIGGDTPTYRELTAEPSGGRSS